MSDAPKRIYLQAASSLGGWTLATWCEDRVSEADEAYDHESVNAELRAEIGVEQRAFDGMENEVARLRAELAEYRRTGRIYADVLEIERLRAGIERTLSLARDAAGHHEYANGLRYAINDLEGLLPRAATGKGENDG